MSGHASPRFCPSPQLTNFFYWKYPEQLFPDIRQSLGDDFRVRQNEIPTFTAKDCLPIYDPSFIAQQLGGQVSGVAQEEIDQLSEQYESGLISPEEAREALLRIASQMRKDGRLAE